MQFCSEPRLTFVTSYLISITLVLNGTNSNKQRVSKLKHLMMLIFQRLWNFEVCAAVRSCFSGYGSAWELCAGFSAEQTNQTLITGNNTMTIKQEMMKSIMRSKQSSVFSSIQVFSPQLLRQPKFSFHPILALLILQSKGVEISSKSAKASIH